MANNGYLYLTFIGLLILLCLVIKLVRLKFPISRNKGNISLDLEKNNLFTPDEKKFINKAKKCYIEKFRLSLSVHNIESLSLDIDILRSKKDIIIFRFFVEIQFEQNAFIQCDCYKSGLNELSYNGNTEKFEKFEKFEISLIQSTLKKLKLIVDE